MTEQPTAAPPIIENIPAELKQRRQWVVWCYEWRADNQGGGKWTKVPYTPGTTSKAMPNKESTWRSFQAAHACYQERADFFSGIGYMFLKDDPYVGGDKDHDLSEAGIPPTYAEISPSGEGIKFIGRATGYYGRKTTKGELYSERRFFTITGQVIAGHETITECQEAVDAFLASLGGTDRAIRTGTPGNGSRAAHAAAIAEEDWEEGRRLLREELSRLLARVRASAAPKMPGKETQLYYVLRGDFSGLHSHYPGAGAVRPDGSIDSSQIRAIFANGVRMRNFTFPQFVALFYHFYGAECLAKWGTTQAFREEAATLWLRGRTPRATDTQAPTSAPRGRAGSHSNLLERTYRILQSYRAGISAIVTLQDVATDLGTHKGTAHRAINDLVHAKRITKKRHGQHGGLIIDFISELIYSKPELIYSYDEGDTEPQNGTLESADRAFSPELIYKNGIEHSNAVNDDSVSAEDETGENNPELIYSDDAEKELGVVKAQIDTPAQNDERENENTPNSIYISNTVYLRQGSINSEKRLSLADAIGAAFDALPKSRTLESTGELKRWPVSAQRVEEFIQAEYPAQWPVAAIRYWIDRIRKRRRAQPFDELKALKRDALEKKAAAARKRIDAAEKRALTDPSPEIRDFYGKLARQLEGAAGLIAWELSRRDGLDTARIESEGYSQGELSEMLEIIEKEYKPKRKDAHPPPAQANGLIERLKLAKQQKEETQL